MEVVDQIVKLATFASKQGYGVLSTGEKLAVALVLNRPDWLAEMDYTLAEAIDRVGGEWLAAIPAAARAFERQRNDAAYAAADKARQLTLEQLQGQGERGGEIDFAAELVTYGSAPGYRDATLVFDLRPIGANQASLRASLRVRPDDAEPIVRHLRDVHAFAWSRPHAPLDVQPGESRPSWIGN